MTYFREEESLSLHILGSISTNRQIIETAIQLIDSLIYSLSNAKTRTVEFDFTMISNALSNAMFVR
jgi:hypothetical protein